ncbi:MAG: hypothetical protein AB8H79_09105 [Myxococcota bacterium]
MRLPEAIGTREIIIAVVAVAVLLLAVIPVFGWMRGQSQRAEVPLLVESIRAREISEAQNFQEGYVSAGWAPRQPTELTTQAVEWTGNAGFDKLGWSPKVEGLTQVFGAYRVAATPSGFTVTGKCDLDGDGEAVWYEATLDTVAEEKSDPGAQ